MRVLICPDSFKESLSAYDCALAIAQGVRAALANAQIDIVPMADGGEGTLVAIQHATGLTFQKVNSLNAIGQEIQSHWLALSPTEAFIEMAQGAGLDQIAPKDRNIMQASTYGVGLMVKAALDYGVNTIYLGLGGSATNDAGAGFISALGGRFYDNQGHSFTPTPKSLKHLDYIDIQHLDTRLSTVKFILACDVNNPLCGSQGASAIFGPQKGASAKQVEELDNILAHYADCVAQALGKDVRYQPGAGAAGGLGFSALAFLNATFKSGAQTVMHFTQLEKYVAQADLVISGEGQMDEQTMHGKTIAHIAQLTQKYKKPLVVIAGSLGKRYQTMYTQGVTAAFSLCSGPISLEEAKINAALLLQDRACDVIRLFHKK